MTLPGLRGLPVGVFLRALIAEIQEDEIFDVSAQLAYGALLALFPFLIFLVTILGFLPIQGLAQQIMDILRAVMPEEAASLLEETVQHVATTRSPRLLAVSLAGSMYAASSGVASLTSALNRAYDVVETRSWVRVRLQSLLVTLAATVLVIVSTLALLIGPKVALWIATWFGLAPVFVFAWHWLRWPATVVAMSSLLAMLYWACPNQRVPFRLLTPGSVVAVPLWIGMSLLFNTYVHNLASFNKTYGTLGAGVVLLVWIYLSGVIVLIGGEMNAIIASGEAKTPKPHVVHDEDPPTMI